MKNLYILVLILAFAGCSNDNKKPDGGGSTETTPDKKNPVSTSKDPTGKQAEPESGKTDSKTEPGNETAPKLTGESTGTTTGDEKNGLASDPGIDTIVYVGVFARWNYAPGEQYDGSYDSTHSLFVLCSNHLCQKVPSNQVIIQKYGHCDTVAGNLIKIFKVTTNHTFHQIGGAVKIAGDKGIIQIGTKTQEIKLDPHTINRIQKSYNFQREALVPASRDKRTGMIAKPDLQKETNLPVKTQEEFRQAGSVAALDKTQKPEKTIATPAQVDKGAGTKTLVEKQVTPANTINTIKEDKPAAPALKKVDNTTKKTDTVKSTSAKMIKMVPGK
ncbi:MAG: hypothetical protein Q8941_00525 [Bacteroidota bacterium]|nr:hypothetical protein [Bacteroidota bacterium]